MAADRKDEKVTATAANKAPAKIVDATAFTKNAKTVSTIVDKWVGVSPNDIQPGLQSTDLEQIKIGLLLNKKVTVIGYQERHGVIKGKETDYLLIMLVPDGHTAPIILMSGAGVIRKKLFACAEQSALPVAGVMVESEGKDSTYYDFVSESPIA